MKICNEFFHATLNAHEATIDAGLRGVNTILTYDVKFVLLVHHILYFVRKFTHQFFPAQSSSPSNKASKCHYWTQTEKIFQED